MKALQIVPFLYLFIAALFIYDGVTKIMAGEGQFYLSFIVAAIAVFMFFFRRKYSKKMVDHYKKK